MSRTKDDFYPKGSFNEWYLKSEERKCNHDLSDCSQIHMSGRDLNTYEHRSGVNHQSLGRYSSALFDDDAYYKVWIYVNDRDYYADETIVHIEPTTEAQLHKKIVKKVNLDEEIRDSKAKKKSIPDLEKRIKELEAEAKDLRKEVEERENTKELKLIKSLCVGRNAFGGLTLYYKKYAEGRNSKADKEKGWCIEKEMLSLWDHEAGEPMVEGFEDLKHEDGLVEVKIVRK